MMKRALLVYRELDAAEPYQAALRKVGLEPVLAFAGDPASIHGCDGILLMGGTDVNPARYAAARHDETEESDDERDHLELVLISQALEMDLPLLGICRGLQIFNVAHGGTLTQHLDTADHHVRRTKDKGEPAHQAMIELQTHLAEVLGQNTVAVNSRHHQAAAVVGEHLRVAARDPQDGVIEALERPDKRFAIAVQWHPENQVDSSHDQLKLFQAFAKAL
jgi:putative glutamine amidotransferase